MEKEILKIEDLHFSYESGKEVLKGINLAFTAGEKVAILGNNGVGKTTLFLLSNGVLKPTHGRIVLNGEAVSTSKKDLIKLHKEVGIVFQDPDNQIIASTVEAEVSFGPMNMGLKKEDVKKAIDSSLEKMDISHLAKRTTHNLSGGEKRRVAIADILAMNPKLIILDEPTSSLDSLGVVTLEKTLEELAKAGIAVVISTHDIDFAYKFAGRCVMLADGEVVADEDMKTVFHNTEAVDKAKVRLPIRFEIEMEGKGIF